MYFGSGAYGVKAAAETYFGSGVLTLTLHESALLAALIKAPALYDPRDHPRMALRRRNYVIDRMVELGSATHAEGDEAKHAPLGVLPDPPRISTKQPYFVEAVRQEILRDGRLGANRDARDDTLFRGGLDIETTLVPELQAAARRAVDSVLNQPGDPEAALVAIRPSTGQIVAMIAGRDWNASQVNLALGRARRWLRAAVRLRVQADRRGRRARGRDPSRHSLPVGTRDVHVRQRRPMDGSQLGGLGGRVGTSRRGDGPLDQRRLRAPRPPARQWSGLDASRADGGEDPAPAARPSRWARLR